MQTRHIIAFGLVLCATAGGSAYAQAPAQGTAVIEATTASAPAAPTPVAAKTLVDAAVRTAKAENKTVFLYFGASWCGWCRALDTFLHSSEAGSIMQQHYVLLHLTAQESPDKKALENPGVDSVMNAGGVSAMPSYVMLNGNGEKIGSSDAMPDGSGIGYPAEPVEVKAFGALVQKTAPSMTEADLTKVTDYLTTFAKSIKE